jgi:hypothetical protein
MLGHPLAPLMCVSTTIIGENSMKVYALRQIASDYGYMSVVGYHSSLQAAKKQAKELFDRTAEYDIFVYEIQSKFLKEDIIDLLNGDSISSALDGKVIRDFVYPGEEGVVFESAAMKRYRKEEKSK